MVQNAAVVSDILRIFLIVIYAIALAASSLYLFMYALWLSDNDIRVRDYLIYGAYFAISYLEFYAEHYLVGSIMFVPCILFIITAIKSNNKNHHGGPLAI